MSHAVEFKMERVETLPKASGRQRGYAAQAASIRADLILAQTPMLIASSAGRNSLETLAKHLRAYGDVNTVITVTERDLLGLPKEFSLHSQVS